MKKSPDIFHNLFIFEMANNHMGSIEHGIKIVKEIKNVSKNFNFNFAFKFQYRHIDTFIHPDFKKRYEFKYVKRFQETRIEEDQFKRLKDEIAEAGFISACTPFDENSVDLIEKHNFDLIKIGSCSFTDWPLLERIAKTDKPIIASTAGAPLKDIDKVVSFLEHRKKIFALMHCVAEYPTSNENLQLNQIDLLKSRYPQVTIGYSTHENPEGIDSIKIAIAKGATIFEKHVGIKRDNFPLNAYSAIPRQVHRWLESAKEAFKMCGGSEKRIDFSEKESSNLKSLRRGVFAKKRIKEGEKIKLSDIFFAIPIKENQLSVNDISKYTEFIAKGDIDINEPLLLSNVNQFNNRDKIYGIVQQVKGILKESNIFVPYKLDFEISHHYGLDKFNEYGCTIINFVNREYCKKLIVLIPGQKHPEQYHKSKEETFHILYGDVLIILEGAQKKYHPGDIITVEKGTKHIFGSETGAVIEEISSPQQKGDSFYIDEKIAKNKDRKTFITYWMS